MNQNKELEDLKKRLAEPLAQLVACYDDSDGRIKYEMLFSKILALIEQAKIEARIEEGWDIEEHLTMHALDTSVGRKAIDFITEKRCDLSAQLQKLEGK